MTPRVDLDMLTQLGSEAKRLREAERVIPDSQQGWIEEADEIASRAEDRYDTALRDAAQYLIADSRTLDVILTWMNDRTTDGACRPSDPINLVKQCLTDLLTKKGLL